MHARRLCGARRAGQCPGAPLWWPQRALCRGGGVIEGLSHVTCVVRDLERMTRILTGIFGAREVYASGEETFSVAREKFFQVGDVWIAVMEGEPSPSRSKMPSSKPMRPR